MTERVIDTSASKRTKPVVPRGVTYQFAPIKGSTYFVPFRPPSNDSSNGRAQSQE
jgi:hypothetical protein